jgi:hypothetical protein
MCALCRRNLLAGERFRLWRSPNPAKPAARTVCALCEPGAGRDGWVRAAERVELERPAGPSGSVKLVA